MDNKTPELDSRDRDSFIICRNSQGLEVRATILRITRFLVVFEVYNPYSIVQLSEVLSDFKIVLNDKLVYSGRAVVSNLVNTGVILVCETTLDEAWLDVDVFSPLSQRGRLQHEFQEFIADWQRIQQVIPNFKIAVADMQTLLVDLRRWLDQVEIGIRSDPSSPRNQLEREVIHTLEEPMVPVVMGWFEQFDQVADQVEPDLLPIHRAFAKRLLHPLVLCSPFVYRTYQKPLGYAGDYEMVNMILREPYEGSSLFAKIINVCFLKNPPAEAHRNRIRYLIKQLTKEVGRCASQGRRARIFNLGCGPAQEVQAFIESEDLSNHADFLLLDFNDETLEHSSGNLRALKTQHRRETGLEFKKKSVHQILKEATRPSGDLQPASFDLVYCAGLFDYMSDRICKRLMTIFYDLVAPGGLLIATNVDASRPFRHSMEFILEWHLICRNQKQLAALQPDKAPPETCQVLAESTGVNVFCEIRKPFHG